MTTDADIERTGHGAVRHCGKALAISKVLR